MTHPTPGPWQIHEATHIDGEYWASIRQSTGHGPITDIVGEEGNHTKYFQTVAGMKYLVTPVDEQRANARLIAAASDMLAALNHCLTAINVQLHNPYNDFTRRQFMNNAADKARAAITKSTQH